MHIRDLLNPADYAEHQRLVMHSLQLEKQLETEHAAQDNRARSLAEVAQILEISKERVRQVERLALHKLKNNPTIQSLK